MKNNDVFPTDDFGFDSFESNFITVVNANKLAWVIDPTQLGFLPPLQTKWSNAFAPCKVKVSSTATQRKAKNMAKAAFVKQLRLFIKSQIQTNPNITDDQRVTLGLKPHKGNRSKSTKPTDTPTVTVENANGELVKIFCKQQPGNDGASRRGKPDGVKKVKVVYVVSATNTPPKDPTACTQNVYSGKTAINIQLSVGDRGSYIFGYACWVNGLDQQGPWSALFSGLIS